MLFGTKKDIDTIMHSLTPGRGQWSPLSGFLTDLSREWTNGCITPHADSCYNNAERCSSSLKWGETPAIKVEKVPEQLPLLKDRRRPEYEAGISCGWKNKKEPACSTNTPPGWHTSAKLPAWWSSNKYWSICQCQRSEDRSQQHLMRPQQILSALQKTQCMTIIFKPHVTRGQRKPSTGRTGAHAENIWTFYKNRDRIRQERILTDTKCRLGFKERKKKKNSAFRKTGRTNKTPWFCRFLLFMKPNPDWRFDLSWIKKKKKRARWWFDSD